MWQGRALHTWDKLLKGVRRPAQELAVQDAGNGNLADVIASQFQRTLAPDVQLSSLHRSIVFGERREAIGQLEDA